MILFINPTPDPEFFKGIESYKFQEPVQTLSLHQLWESRGNFQIKELIEKRTESQERLILVFWGSSFAWAQQLIDLDKGQIQYIFWGNDLIDEWLNLSIFDTRKILVQVSKQLLKDYLNQLIKRHLDPDLEKLQSVWRNQDKYFKSFLVEYFELRANLEIEELRSQVIGLNYNSQFKSPPAQRLHDLTPKRHLHSELISPDVPGIQDWPFLVPTLIHQIQAI